MKIITLDGNAGGGQLLRTALSLSMITGQPFRMTDIRGRRAKPGLMRQHLTCVKAACLVSEGVADGAELGSTELVFRAGTIRAGNYSFAIGTAGSTSLLMQTLLPALWLAGAPSHLRLEGGTHNPMAPPFEFIDRVYLPVIERMGAAAKASLIQSGFIPAGGGLIECEVQACNQFLPMEHHERGELSALRLRVPYREVHPKIGARMIAAAKKLMPCDDAEVEIRAPGPGSGICCYYEAEFERATELVSAVGEKHITAEKVGLRAAKGMRDFIQTHAPVGKHLADQLLLPLALAGEGSFTCAVPDAHVPSNMAIIEKFLPVTFQMERLEGGRCQIRVKKSS